MSKTVLAQKSKKSNSSTQIIVLAALLVGLGLGAAFSFAANKPKAEQIQNTSTPKKNGADTNTVGNAAEGPSLVFNLQKVSQDTVGNQVFIPNLGNKFVIVDVSFLNTSQVQIPIVPVTQIYLKDSSGKSYYIAPAPMAAPLMAGNLPAGDKLAGQLAFEVPADVKTANFYFDPGLTNQPPIVYKVNL